jgi:3-deoxy-manno-octulosonate cytidylyltransferase (CMP-KDO synthetase)
MRMASFLSIASGPRRFCRELPADERMVRAAHWWWFSTVAAIPYPRLSPTPLEQLEKLEQLRALEHGFRIKVATTELTSQGDDTPEDLDRVRAAVAGGRGESRRGN